MRKLPRSGPAPSPQRRAPLSPALRRALRVLAAAALAAGCREKPKVGMDELFTIRSQGQLFLQQGDLAEAEKQFRQLVELAPDDPLGHANLGLTYLRAGRTEEAIPQIQRARELDPSNVDFGLMLARGYAQQGRAPEARALLESLLRDAPRNPRVLYALAELDSGAGDAAGLKRLQARLRQVLAAEPANLAVRLSLAGALLRGGDADSVVHQLEEVRRIPPAVPPEAAPFLARALEQLRAARPEAARAPFERFVEQMKLTTPYQAALDRVNWVEGYQVGRLVLTYVPKDFLTLHGLHEQLPEERVRFVEATVEAGLPSPRSASAPAGAAPVAVAVGDLDGDGVEDLFLSGAGAGGAAAGARVYRALGGQAMDVSQRAGISLPAGATFATLADYDNDGWLDVFALGGDGRGHLFRNRGNLTFEDLTARAGVSDVGGARGATFVDLDHDGDLDLLLWSPTALRVYRNNLDGGFSEATAAFGLSGTGASDVAFADFDGDGRIDLFLAGAAGGRLLLNRGASRFQDATAASGLRGGAGTAAVGDYDNDGLLDLFVAGGAEPALWRGQGDGTFVRDRRSAAALRRLASASATAARFVDYDNDGWLDLAIAGRPASGGGRGALLLHNQENGSFDDRTEILPPQLGGAGYVDALDLDQDGDQDLLLATNAGVRLLRNEGGNLRLAANVTLKALRTGSGKNNDFGVGARVELRAGELRQTRVVTGRITHFGLGPHVKADVLRIEWPNGVPQTVFWPGTDQDVVENEALKGSCAFAYTWDGTRFRFVTDVMWRSALGMPMGLMGGGTAFAPAGASREYLRIPGDALRPKDGRYLLQLTEELWETAYVDRIRLLAVDHPDSVDVFVDERFVPPGPVDLRLYHAARPRPPRSATDGRGADLLPALLRQDSVYVSDLTPTRFQGIVEPHDLVMDLGEGAGRPGTYLFLRGWIYPTDASINVALSQQSRIRPAAPSLEVRDARGRWTTVVPFLSFPSGKDKTMVIDLAGKFPTRDHHIRIRTNMQIYWDQAFVAEDAGQLSRVTPLAPRSADLHFRGFSRTYRKGGRYGPHWFAYDDVTRQSPWRPITGAFTRYGDVLPLLEDADDRFVVMAAGDETTLEFDAAAAPPPPPGWRRDFLLYSDGWIKDSDLNTAHGTTVEPLPFHAIRAYPYAPGEAYPSDPGHQRYLREYNTRIVGRRAPAAPPARAGNR